MLVPAHVYSGHLFAVVSRRGDRVKILAWDSGGFIPYYKPSAPIRFLSTD